MTDPRRPSGSMPPADEIDRELDFHTEMQTRRFVASGVPADEARRRAVQRLGNVQAVRDACRAIDLERENHMRRQTWWSGFTKDLGYAVRGLRRSPLFTAAAVATLGIGIGAATAMFSVVHAVLLRGLPYQESDRLVVIWNSYGQTLPEAAIAPAEFADIQETPGDFDGVAALQPSSASLTGDCAPDVDCQPERVVTYRVSPNLFELAGVLPRIGRPFTSADGDESGDRVTLLSDALWRRRYGADPATVGRTITVGGQPVTVIGVMPTGVRFPDEPIGFLKERADLWIAYRWEQSRSEGRGNQYLGMFGRVAADEPIDSAQRTLDRVAARFKETFPDRYAGEERRWKLVATPFRDQIVGDVRPALLVLFAAVSLLLVIACVNVANLLIARGSARAREFAVRAALGAARGRLVRQLLAETGLLALVGTAVGIALALTALAAVRQLDPGDVPWLTTATLDSSVLAFSIGLTLLTTLVVGLAPALRQAQASLRPTFGEGQRGGGASPLKRRFRQALVVMEVTMAVLVLVGAGLVVRSFTALRDIRTGITDTSAVVFQLSPRGPRYQDAASVVAFHTRATEALGALPGVTGASAAYPLPMSGDHWGGSFYVEGRTGPEGQPEPHAEWASALPGYFRALGIAMREGRDFAATDQIDAPPVVIVDESLARRYWPGESAIGKRLDADGKMRTSSQMATVIGVVSHVRNGGPKDDGEPQVYMSLRQAPQRTVYYAVRPAGDAASVIASIRGAVRAIDPELAIAKLGSMRGLVDHALARDRFNALVLSAFAMVALALTVVGLYGVISGVVSERTREIGIRVALGGRPAQILRGVLAEGCGLALAGVALGLGAALVVSRGLSGLLHGVSPGDPTTFVGVATVLLISSLAASWIPARRATRVDPVDVLRD